jgi:probable HAF family extracellular repeat protein
MDTPSGTNHAASWDLSGSIRDLSTHCLSCSSRATAINPAGIIVGWTAARPATAAWWDRRGVHTLASFGGNLSEANAVNANGDIVGDAFTSSFDPYAVLWQGGSVIDLGLLPGTTGSYPTSVSSDTWIVGIGLNYGFESRAFLVVPDPVCGDMRDLTALLDSSGAGWTLTRANGNNDRHQIIGQGVAPDGGYHAFLLAPNDFPLCYPS